MAIPSLSSSSSLSCFSPRPFSDHDDPGMRYPHVCTASLKTAENPDEEPGPDPRALLSDFC